MIFLSYIPYTCTYVKLNLDFIYLNTYVFLLYRKCHNDESTIPPWKQAILDQITSGISSVIDQLSKTVPSANNKSIVNITPTTNTTAIPNLSKNPIEHAKRKLDFQEEEEKEKEIEDEQKKGKTIYFFKLWQTSFSYASSSKLPMMFFWLFVRCITI